MMGPSLAQEDAMKVIAYYESKLSFKKSKAAAPPGSSPSEQHGPGAFDDVPDAVLSGVFKALGPRASWPLRRVCGRWRRVVEEMEWASFELRIKAADVDMSRAAAHEASEQGDESAYDVLSALFERRRLRLSAGASVSLRPELSRLVAFDRNDGRSVAAAHQIHRRRVEAACGLLRAIARSHSGPSQPREVSIELMRDMQDISDDVDDRELAIIAARQVDKDFLRSYLLGVLSALQPAEGAASSSLESLSVSFNSGLFKEFGVTFGEGLEEMRSKTRPWPAPADLRAALAPFAQLRSLSLFFGVYDKGAQPEAAEAIAGACPLLRSVRLLARDEAVLAAFAPLAHLQQLAVIFSTFGAPDVSDGVVALADGPAGQSLQSIEFVIKLAVLMATCECVSVIRT
eukprot:tig00000057_g35.t1